MGLGASGEIETGHVVSFRFLFFVQYEASSTVLNATKKPKALESNSLKQNPGQRER